MVGALRRAGLAFAASAALASAAAAGGARWELPPTVLRIDEAFHVEAKVVIDRPRAALVREITRFEALDRLSDSILESRVLETSGDETVVFLALKLRPWGVLCARFGQRQVVSVEPDRVHVRVEGEHNPFIGHATWQLDDEGARTRVAFDSRMEPVTPIPRIARGTAERFLRREAERTIEALSRASPGPSLEEEPPVARAPEPAQYRLRLCPWVFW